ARAARGLHGLRRLPARLPRLLLRDLPPRPRPTARSRGERWHRRRHARAAGGAGDPGMSKPDPERRLMEGSEAIAEAAIVAGCRFFTGYPMTPFTEVLENFARLLPDVGGHCINAESELEAI